MTRRKYDPGEGPEALIGAYQENRALMADNERLRRELAEESRRHMEQIGELTQLAEQRRVELAEALDQVEDLAKLAQQRGQELAEARARECKHDGYRTCRKCGAPMNTDQPTGVE